MTLSAPLPETTLCATCPRPTVRQGKRGSKSALRRISSDRRLGRFVLSQPEAPLVQNAGIGLWVLPQSTWS